MASSLMLVRNRRVAAPTRARRYSARPPARPCRSRCPRGSRSLLQGRELPGEAKIEIVMAVNRERNAADRLFHCAGMVLVYGRLARRADVIEAEDIDPACASLPVIVFSHSISMREKSVTIALIVAPFFFPYLTASRAVGLLAAHAQSGHGFDETEVVVGPDDRQTDDVRSQVDGCVDLLRMPSGSATRWDAPETVSSARPQLLDLADFLRLIVMHLDDLDAGGVRTPRVFDYVFDS